MVKPQLYSVCHDKTGTVKALLAAGADVNHQEMVNKLNVLCLDISACVVDHLFMLTVMQSFMF